MGYISNLRKKIGHEPMIGVGTTILVWNQKNEILLNLRSDTKDWGIPGGAKELYETIEECAKRELKEETNLETNKLTLLAVLSGKDYYFQYPNKDEMDCVIVLYETNEYEGKLQINDGESAKLMFFNLNNLPLLESRAKNILNKIKREEIKSNFYNQ